MMVAETNLHGVAVAVGEYGLLIEGESGSGKSSLAASMLANWPFGRVSLVADDRVLLQARYGRLIAHPHPAIAGHMELRGQGIVSARHLEKVVVTGILKLGQEPTPRLPEADDMMARHLGITLPCAVLPAGHAANARLIGIWPYFSMRMQESRSNIDAAP